MRQRTTSTIAAILFLMILSVGFPAAPAQASCDEIDPPGVLPDDDVCPGWIRDGELRTAYTIEELADIINGAAFLHGQYGFVAAAFQNYAGDVGGEPTLMTLNVFNQGSAENAEALYNDPNSGSGDPVGDWEGTGNARMRIAFGTVSFQFWESCFFATIIVVTGGEDAVPHARCMAETVVDRIQNPTPVESHTWGELRAVFR